MGTYLARLLLCVLTLVILLSTFLALHLICLIVGLTPQDSPYISLVLTILFGLALVFICVPDPTPDDDDDDEPKPSPKRRRLHKHARDIYYYPYSPDDK